MKKLIWKYDKKNHEWYTLESAPWANDGMQIIKHKSSYTLRIDYMPQGLTFKKVRSAKIVANLIKNG